MGGHNEALQALRGSVSTADNTGNLPPPLPFSYPGCGWSLSDVTGVLLQAGYSSGNDGAQAVQADKTEGRLCSSSGV